MLRPCPRRSRCLRWWRACPVAPGLRGWGTWRGAGRWRGGASSTWGPWCWCWRWRHRAMAREGLDPVRTELLPRAIAGVFACVTLAALSSVVALVLVYLGVYGLNGA